MIPEHYFYLVDLETDQPVAIFSADHCRSFHDMNNLEAQLRVQHRVDDTDSGLVLRYSHTAPLPIEKVRAVLAAMKRRGGARA